MSFVDSGPEFVAPDPRNPNRDSAIPRFYTEAVKNEAESQKMGQPVFYDRDMVEILVPGDRNATPHRIVNQEIKNRWPREYNAWKAGMEAPLNGTPIEQLPGITSSRVEELKFARIRTIEALAEIPDQALLKSVSMGGHALRAQAQRWLDSTKGAAPMEALAAENAAKDARIKELEGQMADLLKRVDAISAAQANAAGAPPQVV